MIVELPEHLVKTIEDYNKNRHRYPTGSIAALNTVAFIGEQVARICKDTNKASGELSDVK